MGCFQEVPKTADHAPTRTFFLWSIRQQTLLPQVLDRMCHAALNLRLRLAHEMQQEQEVSPAVEPATPSGGLWVLVVLC